MRQLNAILIALALALPLLAAGCGGTDPSSMPDGMTGMGNHDLALFASCTDNSQCQSGLCTQISYDRSPTPICTFQCDASNMNPMCPYGCNLKGYCKKPM
jgi:hypothetical protein